MAPEQIQGRPLDGRADVYALGCVAFEALTGRPPFQLESDVAVIWAHMRNDPPNASALNRALPRAVDGVLGRALAKDPADRHATCGELAAELSAAVAARRRRSAGMRLPFRVRAPRWRRRWAVPALVGAGAGVVVGALVAGAVVGDGGTTTVTREATRLDTELIRHVPAGIRASCVATPPPTPDFSSSVSCRPRGAAVERIEYSKSLSGSRMRAQLISDAVARGIAVFNAPVRPAGRCGSSHEAVRDWTDGGRERTQITPGVSGPAQGRLLCSVAPNGWAAIEWTDRRVDVLTRAFGLSASALYRWWTRHGGPVP
jgi:protein kinase-like protein